MNPTHCGARLCVNCQGEIKKWPLRGMCHNCYAYWRRTGRMRPRQQMRRPNGAPRPICRNCRQRFTGKRAALCNTCHAYYLRHGHHRPRYLDRETCRDCGKPKHACLRWAKGLCHACYQYRHTHGVKRPSELIERNSPLGWCECGRAATSIRELRIQDRMERYLLCEDCAEFESVHQEGERR